MSIFQTTNWSKAAADPGLDLLADLPAPNADPLETVSGAPATSSQELMVLNCDNSTPTSALKHVEDAIEKINTGLEAHYPLATPAVPLPLGPTDSRYAHNFAVTLTSRI